MKEISSFIILFAITIIALQAQNSININAAGAKNLQSQESSEPAIRELFNETERYRTFDFNTQLANLKTENIGDTLLLYFFEDKQYKSIIQYISVNTEGRTNITSKIIGSHFAYCYIGFKKYHNHFRRITFGR